MRVPVANRVGAENDGWRVTMVTLSFERGTAFAGEVVACRRVLGELAREARRNGRWDDPALRRRIGRLHAEFRALWPLIQWNVGESAAASGAGGSAGTGGTARAGRSAGRARTGGGMAGAARGARSGAVGGGGAVPGIGGSVFKLRYPRARQELYDTAAEVLGPDRSTWTGPGCPTGSPRCRTPSRPAPRRSSGTSWPNASSACRRGGEGVHFQLDEEQRALRDGVRALLEGRFAREAPVAVTGAPELDRERWRELGAAGFFALRLPETEGGAGAGLPEAVLAFEQAGRVLLPGPLVATHLAAGEVPGAAAGEAVVTAVRGGLVEWLDAADTVLGDASEAAPVRSVDPLTPLHRVPGPATPSPFADPAEAVLLTAAEQLGSAGRTCELAVQHARAREQFGQPIGAFQAVKHLCAEMLTRVETARAAVYAAAVTADPLDIAAARLLAGEAAVRGARDCLQVHGGMGFTCESEVHLHLKRAWLRTHREGVVTESEEMLAESLLAVPSQERSDQRGPWGARETCRGLWHTGITER